MESDEQSIASAETHAGLARPPGESGTREGPVESESVKRASSSGGGRSSYRHEQVTSRVRIDAVLRMLKGESVDALSLELGISVRRIERWKTRFLEAGSAELSKRTDTPPGGWVAKHSSSLRDWFWLLLALVAVICLLTVFMQRGSQG